MRSFFARCLFINARSLISSYRLNGKQSCHLTNFQNLLFSKQAGIVWVTETWLRDDIENSEILTWRDRASETENIANGRAEKQVQGSAVKVK